MKKAICIFSIVSALITSCNNSSGSGSSSSSSSFQMEVPKSPEELRMELKQQEEANPTAYLSADGTYRENFWGDKLKISCTIHNTATLARFKDAIIRVTFYAKSKTVLGTEDYTVYEIFPPNSKKTVQMKITNYKNVNTIGWDVISAVPIE
jgi:hypothetical protein